jgi:hypothetical protein
MVNFLPDTIANEATLSQLASRRLNILYISSRLRLTQILFVENTSTTHHFTYCKIPLLRLSFDNQSIDHQLFEIILKYICLNDCFSWFSFEWHYISLWKSRSSESTINIIDHCIHKSNTINPLKKTHYLIISKSWWSMDWLSKDNRNNGILQ